MKRRRLLQAGLAGAAAFLASGHTPYNQWTVFRKRHLLVGTCKADPRSYPLGQQIVEVLATHLPDSKARVSRAPDQWRLASLLTSEQFEVILLSTEETAALATGRSPFEDFGAVPLRSLHGFGDHLLLCRPDFPDRHAFLVTATLVEHAATIAGAKASDRSTSHAPLHPGGQAFRDGKAPPHDT